MDSDINALLAPREREVTCNSGGGRCHLKQTFSVPQS